MKRLIIIFVIVTLALLQSKAQTGIYVPQLANFDTALMNIMSTYSVPGGQMAITYQGRLVYSRGFGFANTAAQDSVQPYNIFRVASISKTVTGIAIMKLFEQGLINLDAKVFGPTGILNDAMYQNILDPQVTNITIRNLLHHEGGWNSSVSGDPMFDAYNIATVMGVTSPPGPDVVIQYMLANKMLDFAPGTQSVYSNFGFCVAGRVIEKITGQSYEDYVRNNILIPLGITSMQLANNTQANQLPNEVTYYDYPGAPFAYSVYNNSTLVTWPYGGFNIEFMDSHGGWAASAEDLCKLLCAVDRFNTRPDILLTSTIDTMIKPSAAAPNYGLGINVNSNNNWWHLGSIPGSTTEFIRAGNWQINIAILLNSRTANVSNISSAVDGLLWNVLPTITNWPTFDLFTGVHENKTEQVFSIYPNPIKDILMISYKLIRGEKTELRIFNAIGRQVFKSVISSGNNTIDINQFESGIYFVQLQLGEKVFTQKIIIQH
jgi:CubicO group peptidase (beta-lactamase class C family)